MKIHSMNKLRYIIAIIFCCTGASVYSQSNHILWYDEPAQQFEQSLVLGNGQMGASVFGGIKTEKLRIN
jgi:alpha-L-fucosidase 2